MYLIETIEAMTANHTMDIETKIHKCTGESCEFLFFLYQNNVINHRKIQKRNP